MDDRMIPLSVLREYMPKLKDEDLKELGPVEYEQSKVPEVSKKHAENVRRKVYLPDMTESFARGVEYAGLIAGESKEISEETEARQGRLETYNDQVIVEMTDKDVISAPELIQARQDIVGNSYNTLNDRLINLDNRVTSVNYKMFGAVLDGETDDTEAIRNAHDFANTHGFSVEQHDGVIFITGEIIVKTSTDLSGTRMVLKGNAKNAGKLYKVMPTKEPINVTDFVQSEFRQKTTIIPSLSHYKYHFIKVESDEHFTKRYTTRPTPDTFRKQDSFFILRNGVLADNEMTLHEMTSGNLTVTAIPSETKLTFKAPTFIWEFEDFSDTVTAVEIYRSNVDFVGSQLVIPNESYVGQSSIHKEHVIGVQNAHGFKLVDFEAENITDGQSSGYVLNLEHVHGVIFDNVNLTSGWGATASKYIRSWKVFRSDINRIDSHLGCGNIDVSNSSFTGQWGITVGFGFGDINLNHVKFNYAKSDNASVSKRIVSLGESYGHLYGGNIYIDDLEINVSTPNEKVHLLGSRLVYDGRDYGSNYDFILPNLEARNVRVNGSGVELIGYEIENISSVLNDVSLNNRKIVMPDYVQLENIKLNGNKIKAVEFWIWKSGMANYFVGKETKIKLENIESTLNRKYYSGWTSQDELNSQKWFYDIIGILDPTIFLDVNNDLANVVIFDIDIEKTPTLVFGRAKIDVMKILSSDILFYNSTIKPNYIEMNASSLYALPDNTLSKSIIYLYNLYMFNTRLNLVKVGSSYLTLSEQDLSYKRIFRGNYFPAAMKNGIGQYTAGIYNNYTDTNNFVAP